MNTLYFEPATYLNVGHYYCVKKSAVTEEFVEKIDNRWEEVGPLSRPNTFSDTMIIIYMLGIFTHRAGKKYYAISIGY